MFVVITTIMDEAEQVSNGFIPDSFFDHFELDAYTSPMFDIDEVFGNSQNLSPEQVHTSEVQEPTSNLYLLHSSDNENLSDLNMESWLLDSTASYNITYDCSHMSDAKPSDKIIIVGNGLMYRLSRWELVISRIPLEMYCVLMMYMLLPLSVKISYL
jgi:hypothetical protein